jgi:hypothetical protein
MPAVCETVNAWTEPTWPISITGADHADLMSADAADYLIAPLLGLHDLMGGVLLGNDPRRRHFNTSLFVEIVHLRLASDTKIPPTEQAHPSLVGLGHVPLAT